MQEIVLGQGPSASPSTITRNKWTFADKGSKTAVVVAPEFITLETVAYNTFDDFSEQIRSVLETVDDVVDLELSERLGLRYLDLIRPLGADTVEDYVAPGLAGLNPREVAVRKDQSLYLAQGSTELGQFIFRLTRATGAFVLPPDLQPADLEISPHPDDGDYALLDVDHFAVATHEFQPDALVEILWELHDVVDGIFRSAITPHALQRWEAEERMVMQA